MSELITLVTSTASGAKWQAISALRRRVFIEEQNVPEQEEWDTADATATHVAAIYRNGEKYQLIGCARLLADGQIGRMAVQKKWRGRGVGAALLQFTVGIARRMQLETVSLNAQTHAVGFYQRYGFTADGEEFVDAGIPHRKMLRIVRQ
jgi:predicted GNAT family N-acyltransferase